MTLDLLTPGMLVIVVYWLLTMGSASLVLAVQRKFFLRPDEEQSFAVAGPVAVFTGVLFLMEVISQDV